jgi:hypothetical protein
MKKLMLNHKKNWIGFGNYSSNIWTVKGGIIRYSRHGNQFKAGWIPAMTDNEKKKWFELAAPRGVVLDLAEIS